MLLDVLPGDGRPVEDGELEGDGDADAAELLGDGDGDGDVDGDDVGLNGYGGAVGGGVWPVRSAAL